jgi:hypothetical protein
MEHYFLKVYMYDRSVFVSMICHGDSTDSTHSSTTTRLTHGIARRPAPSAMARSPSYMYVL